MAQAGTTEILIHSWWECTKTKHTQSYFIKHSDNFSKSGQTIPMIKFSQYIPRCMIKKNESTCSVYTHRCFICNHQNLPTMQLHTPTDEYILPYPQWNTIHKLLLKIMLNERCQSTLPSTHTIHDSMHLKLFLPGDWGRHKGARGNLGGMNMSIILIRVSFMSTVYVCAYMWVYDKTQVVHFKDHISITWNKFILAWEKTKTWKS